MLEDAGRIDEAIEVLRPAANANQRVLGVWARMVRLLATRGRFEEALSMLQLELTRRADDPGTSDLRQLMAELLAKLGRLDELRARVTGGESEAAPSLAALLAEHGRAEEAIEVLRPAARTSSAAQRDTESLLADLLARQGRIDELRALAIAGDGAAGLRYASLLTELRRGDEAVTVLTRLADSGRGWFSHEAKIRLADLLAQQGRLEELRARANAGDSEAALRLANLQADRGSTATAISTLFAADSLNDGEHGNHEIQQRLASLLAEAGRVEDLRARANAGDREAALRLADLLDDRGSTEEATAVLRSLPTRKGGGASADQVRRRLAELLAAQGRTDDARAILRAAIVDGDRGASRLLAEVGAGE